MPDTGEIIFIAALCAAGVGGAIFLSSMPDRDDNKEQKASGGSRRTRRARRAHNGTRRA